MARNHIVKRGDTLRKIAKARLGDAVDLNPETS